METVGSALLCIGVVFFVVTFVMIGTTVSDFRLRWTLRHTPVASCGELIRGDSQPRVAALHGRTCPGPNGLLRAPLSGEECVWYQLWVCQIDLGGESSSKYLIYEDGREGLVGFADATGTVLVEPELLRLPIYDSHRSDSAIEEVIMEECDYSRKPGPKPGSRLAELFRRGVLHPEMIRPPDPVSLIVEERIIRPGQDLLVIGRPIRHASGWVVIDHRYIGVKGMGFRPLDEILSKLRDDVRGGVSTVRTLPTVAAVFFAVGYAILWLSRR